MLKNKYKSLMFLIPTIIHYLIAFFMTLNFAEIDADDNRAKFVFLIVELLFFIFLYFIYKKLFEFFYDKKKIKQNEKYIKSFFIYFGILFLVLLCVWPGVWRWDDLYIADRAQHYDLLGWYNILTSMFYIFSFKIIPNYVGVVIVQSAFISVIVSYSINKVYDFFNFNTDKYKFLLYIPFLLFPVLDNNLYPFRCTWCAYLILFLLVKMVDFYQKSKLNWKECISLTFLVTFISFFRSEQVYFLGVLVIAFLAFYKMKKIKFYQALISIIITFLMTVGLYSLNDLYMLGSQTTNYKVTGTIGALKSLVNKAIEDDKKELLDDIDSAINVNVLLENQDKIESDIYWLGLVREDKIEENFNKYLYAIIKLNLSYPNLAISSRMKSIADFYKWNGISLYDSSSIFDPIDSINQDYISETYMNFITKTKTINLGLRKKTIKVLEGRALKDDSNTVLYKMWYLHMPLIISVIFMGYLLIKKKIFYFFIYFCTFLKAILVFFTQPAFLFIYYFSDYIMGYFALSIMLLIFIKWINKKREKLI